jgi:hypothetical protein
MRFLGSFNVVGCTHIYTQQFLQKLARNNCFIPSWSLHMSNGSSKFYNHKISYVARLQIWEVDFIANNDTKNVTHKLPPLD